MPDVVARHSWRELCRHALENICQENSIGAVQYFCTDEERVPFQWL
jgi:hypothetical protein